jgi:putative aminophosphonate oxidoreductase
VTDETRDSTPPALDRNGRPRSLWLQEALAEDPHVAPRLEGDARADVCIVGGGYTGLWTALRLKEADPSIDVAIVEADVCGGGASGRNGGFVLSWWPKFSTLVKQSGTQEALRLATASAEAVSAIGSFCEQNGIEAHYQRDGWLWAATSHAQLDAWRSTIEDIDRNEAHPFRELSPEEVATRTGSPIHLAGVWEESGAIVQPALLARGLRRVAMARGVRVYEATPMVGLERSSPLRVRTPRGTVAADRVVLAMNAWAIRFRRVRSRIIVVGSDIVATPPMAERLRQIGWVDGLCISDSRLLVHYYRTTRDGRLAFGKGGGAIAFGKAVGERFEGPAYRAARIAAALRRTYPSLADVPVAASWTGPIDRSRTSLPFFGPLEGRPDLLVGVGYSGDGVGPSYLGGRILSSLALGRDDEWSGSGVVGLPSLRFPPEPFRFLGGHVVRSAIERKERLEDEGRRPGPLTRGLVRLAPAGLVPVNRD